MGAPNSHKLFVMSVPGTNHLCASVIFAAISSRTARLTIADAILTLLSFEASGLVTSAVKLPASSTPSVFGMKVYNAPLRDALPVPTVGCSAVGGLGRRGRACAAMPAGRGAGRAWWRRALAATNRGAFEPPW